MELEFWFLFENKDLIYLFLPNLSIICSEFQKPDIAHPMTYFMSYILWYIVNELRLKVHWITKWSYSVFYSNFQQSILLSPFLVKHQSHKSTLSSESRSYPGIFAPNFAFQFPPYSVPPSLKGVANISIHGKYFKGRLWQPPRNWEIQEPKCSDSK